MAKTGVYKTKEQAIGKLRNFGAVDLKGTIYAEKHLGLKLLGAVDYLIKNGVTVIFGKAPAR